VYTFDELHAIVVSLVSGKTDTSIDSHIFDSLTRIYYFRAT